MKITRNLIIWFIGILIVLALLCAWVFAHRVILISQEDIVVESYPLPDHTRFPNVGKIKSGEKIQVLSCDDLKHYTAVHVRLGNGQEGYVLEGKFRFEFYPFWSSINSPVSYSCPSA